MSRPANKAKTHFLKNDNLSSILEPASPGETAFTATKVVVTIGPACQDVETLCQLLEAGATCARCDLTWGPLEFHMQSLTNLQKAMHRTRKLCAIMIDTIGRELLINREAKLDAQGWPVHEHSLSVKVNDKIVITTKHVSGGSADDGLLPISYPKFPSMCVKGDTIFLGKYLVTGSEDSSLYLTVDDVSSTDVTCVARNNSQLDGLLTVFHTERSPDGLSNVQNDLPILCPEDKAALKALSRDFEIDFISLSFTRHSGDVEQARDYLRSIGLENTKVLAKCETRQALFEFRDIAQQSDGIILSRGNLGLDVLPEKMALIQKAIISNCNIMGKPILITRVVDTMIHAPRPTRAEATDVANAVLDGCDGILLGAETLRGKQPVATVETILHICKQAERCFDHKHHFDHLMNEITEQIDLERVGLSEQDLARSTSDGNLPNMLGHNGSFGSGHEPLGSDPALNRMGTSRSVSYMNKLESLASSAVRSADKVGAKLIIVYTQSGTTAGLVSKYRPPVPILTLVVPTLKCTDGLKWTLEGRANARQCLIHRGLLPVLAAPSPSGETLLAEAVTMCVKSGMVQPHDHIVVIQKVHDSFMMKIVSVDPEGGGIASIRPQSLIDMMKNAHAAAGGHMDDESHAAIEAQIKQQLSGSPAPAANGTARNLVPEGNFTRHETPSILGEPALQNKSITKVAQPHTTPEGEGITATGPTHASTEPSNVETPSQMVRGQSPIQQAPGQPPEPLVQTSEPPTQQPERPVQAAEHMEPADRAAKPSVSAAYVVSKDAGQEIPIMLELQASQDGEAVSELGPQQEAALRLSVQNLLAAEAAAKQMGSRPDFWGAKSQVAPPARKPDAAIKMWNQNARAATENGGRGSHQQPVNQGWTFSALGGAPAAAPSPPQAATNAPIVQQPASKSPQWTFSSLGGAPAAAPPPPPPVHRAPPPQQSQQSQQQPSSRAAPPQWTFSSLGGAAGAVPAAQEPAHAAPVAAPQQPPSAAGALWTFSQMGGLGEAPREPPPTEQEQAAYGRLPQPPQPAADPRETAVFTPGQHFAAESHRQAAGQPAAAESQAWQRGPVPTEVQQVLQETQHTPSDPREIISKYGKLRDQRSGNFERVVPPGKPGLGFTEADTAANGKPLSPQSSLNGQARNDLAVPKPHTPEGRDLPYRDPNTLPAGRDSPRTPTRQGSGSSLVLSPGHSIVPGSLAARVLHQAPDQGPAAVQQSRRSPAQPQQQQQQHISTPEGPPSRGASANMDRLLSRGGSTNMERASRRGSYGLERVSSRSSGEKPPRPGHVSNGIMRSYQDLPRSSYAPSSSIMRSYPDAPAEALNGLAGSFAEHPLKGPVAQSMPITRYERSSRKKIPRIVGGKVVPGIVSAGGNAVYAPQPRKWDSRSYSIPEDAPSRMPSQGLSDIMPRDSPLRGPASQSLPVNVVQRNAALGLPGTPTRGAAPQLSNGVVPGLPSKKEAAETVASHPVTDADLERIPSASSFSSSLDRGEHEQGRQPKTVFDPSAGPPGPSRLGVPLQIQGTGKAGPATAPATPTRQPSYGMVGPHDQPGSTAGVSRQPSAASGMSLTTMNSNPEAYLPKQDSRAYLPKQNSTAEEVMKDYLVGESIKKAQLKALHPKAKPKARKGFFKALLG